MDEGVIDLYIGRKGISGKVVVQSVGEGEAGTFKVVSVKVKVRPSSLYSLPRTFCNLC